MRRRPQRTRSLLVVMAIALMSGIAHAQTIVPQVLPQPVGPSGSAAIEPAVTNKGAKLQRVIITLSGIDSGTAAASAIRTAQDAVLALLEKSGEPYTINRRYDMLPLLALSSTDRGVALLKTAPGVTNVQVDDMLKPF